MKKKSIVVFLSDSTLEALNNKAKIDEQSRSTVASSIIQKAVQKYKPTNE